MATDADPGSTRRAAADLHGREHDDRRFASSLLLTGAVLLVAGNLAHPIDTDPESTSRLEIAGGSTWVVIHLVIAVGILLAAAGLVVFAGTAATPSGRRAGTVATFGSIVGATALAIMFGGLDGYAGSTLADRWATATDNERPTIEAAALAIDLAESATAVIGVLALFGLGVGALAVSLFAERTAPRWLAWLGAAVGVAGVVTAITWALDGPSTLTLTVMFRPMSVAATIWLVGLAITIRRPGSGVEQARG